MILKIMTTYDNMPDEIFQKFLKLWEKDLPPQKLEELLKGAEITVRSPFMKEGRPSMMVSTTIQVIR